MDVIENPILTFSALSLIIILLGTSLYMLRARMILLENKLIQSDEINQTGLDQLEGIMVSSFEQSEGNRRNSIEELLKALSEKIEISTKGISGCVQESQTSIENSVSQLIQANEQKVTGLISSVSDSVGTVAETVKNNAVYTKGVVERSGLKVSEEISDSGKMLAEKISDVAKRVSAVEDKGLSELKAAKTELVVKIESSTKEQTHKLINNSNDAADSTKELIKDSTDSLTDSLELVRVSNVLTENRNLYDQGRLVLETEAFVKTFDSCQLTQIEDKETGQVTKNEFQNGKISTSKTYRTDSLEYVGHYQDGVLKKMEDLTGPEGNNVTQYEYDEAGEVESVI
jgi:hypothetical protein